MKLRPRAAKLKKKKKKRSWKCLSLSLTLPGECSRPGRHVCSTQACRDRFLRRNDFHQVYCHRFWSRPAGRRERAPVTEGQGPNAASATATHIPMARTQSCGQCCKGGREMSSSFMATCSGGGGQFERTTSVFTAPTLSLERESQSWTNWFLSFVSQNPENGRREPEGEREREKTGRETAFKSIRHESQLELFLKYFWLMVCVLRCALPSRSQDEASWGLRIRGSPCTPAYNLPNPVLRPRLRLEPVSALQAFTGRWGRRTQD